MLRATAEEIKLVAYVLYNKFTLCKNRTKFGTQNSCGAVYAECRNSLSIFTNFAYILSHTLPFVRTSQFRNIRDVRTCEVGAILTTLKRRTCNDAWQWIFKVCWDPLLDTKRVTRRPHEFRSYVLSIELRAEWESFSVEMSLPHFSMNVPLNFPGNFISNLSANARSNRPPLLLDHAIPYQPDDLCQPPLHNHAIPYLPTSWPVPTNTDYNLYLRSCIEAPWYTFPVPKKHTHTHTHTYTLTHQHGSEH